MLMGMLIVCMTLIEIITDHTAAITNMAYVDVQTAPLPIERGQSRQAATGMTPRALTAADHPATIDHMRTSSGESTPVGTSRAKASATAATEIASIRLPMVDAFSGSRGLPPVSRTSRQAKS